MHNKTKPDPPVLDGTKLWDEILKANAVLGSETSSFQENSEEPLGSTLMDVSHLVVGTDCA